LVERTHTRATEEGLKSKEVISLQFTVKTGLPRAERLKTVNSKL